MIFADKLIQLRKKAGWSQEELAAQMEVTRQSVSKWEGAQSIPELDKLIRLSELFGVSTDYLLKDEVEVVEAQPASEELSPLRRVSMEEANTFLDIKSKTSNTIALATFLCILSPICLINLAVMSEIPSYGISDSVATGVGMSVLLLIVTVAVILFISSGRKTEDYDFLEKEVFETAYGVSGMVKGRKEQYQATYTRHTIIGVSLCLIALLPIFGGVIIAGENALLITAMLSISLVIAAVGVYFLIRSGIIWTSYEKLLQEGDYSRDKKEHPSVIPAITTVYWLVVVAFYVVYGLLTDSWRMAGVIFGVAGILCPAVIILANMFSKRK